MLTSAPASVDGGDLDARDAKVWKGPEAGHRDARLDEAQHAVEAVDTDRAQHVGDCHGDMLADGDEEQNDGDDVRRDEDRVVEPRAEELGGEQEKQVRTDERNEGPRERGEGDLLAEAPVRAPIIDCREKWEPSDGVNLGARKHRKSLTISDRMNVGGEDEHAACEPVDVIELRRRFTVSKDSIMNTGRGEGSRRTRSYPKPMSMPTRLFFVPKITTTGIWLNATKPARIGSARGLDMYSPA